MKRQKEQIEIILDGIDFKKIHSVMKFLNWEWKIQNNESKVPDISELKSTAEFCLNKVANSNDEIAHFETGGFEADKIENVLELRFVLEKANPLASILNS